MCVYNSDDTVGLCLSGPQAIEAFALMVKTTAQTLQSFGTELAETELPNDAQATSNLLATHTEKKGQMKVRAWRDQVINIQTITKNSMF